ncbi:TRS31 [Hepatospora eriocheir]|uniref:TRS31 n=1 Tax=Hepatospora eriocheir TaxID=1081669 RepID=A0A1X0Q6X0_9MICR|nr:TRS31 [Hepatospora eriocheir]ORD99515.1 TRS31 [Hepatospora eriocheir]
MTREILLRFIVSSFITNISKLEIDVEDKLIELGYDMGKRLLLVSSVDFTSDCDGLLYFITYEYLSLISNTNRQIEKIVTDNSIKYLLIEEEPFWSQFIKFNKKDDLNDYICIDAITGGIIKSVLMAKGYESKVVSHNVIEDNKRKVIHQIIIDKFIKL